MTASKWQGRCLTLAKDWQSWGQSSGVPQITWVQRLSIRWRPHNLCAQNSLLQNISPPCQTYRFASVVQYPTVEIALVRARDDVIWGLIPSAVPTVFYPVAKRICTQILNFCTIRIVLYTSTCYSSEANPWLVLCTVGGYQAVRLFNHWQQTKFTQFFKCNIFIQPVF